MVEVMEVSSIDNKRRSVLAVPVALSVDSHLQWVGFNVTNGKSFPQYNGITNHHYYGDYLKLRLCKYSDDVIEVSNSSQMLSHTQQEHKLLLIRKESQEYCFAHWDGSGLPY